MPLFPARHSPLLRQLVFGVKVGLAAHCFAAYVGYVQLTDGPSMLPTLPVRGAYVWVSARHRQGRGVRAGDVVSLRHPLRPGEGMGKRILGMPGDFVLRDTPGSGSEVMVQIPGGHCWVAGDNPPWSLDSRDFGPVPLALIKGKSLAVCWPPSKWKWIRNGLQEVDT